MEKIIDFGGENDREIEASTSALAIDSTDTRLGNQLNNLTCDTTPPRCCLTEQATTESGSQQNSNSGNRTQPSRKFFNFKLTMVLQYSKEFLGFLALILTTYATLLNKEPIIGGTLSPKPIFPRDSIVQEWPYGNLIDVQSKVAVSELSLIFFYAPWCAESLFAKKVYNAVANLYSREAYFAAVNCWQPNSGCRTIYSNVYKWPVLMAYLPNAFSVQYNGPWSSNSLMNFIEGLMTPIVRVHTMQELTQLRIANDAIVFGAFSSCDSKEYQTFFQTSLKWLESSSFQNVKFAVYIGEETSTFFKSEHVQAPVIKLFTTNDTIDYNNAKWVSKKIINFLKQYLPSSNVWMHFSNSKSTTMHKHLQRGPVLLMFAPRTSSIHHYFIIKQLMYSHESYQHDLNNTVLNEYITDIQKEYPMKLRKLARFCEDPKQMQYQDIQASMYEIGVLSDRLFSLGMQSINTSSDAHHSAGKISCSFKYCEGEFVRHNIYQKASVKRSKGRLDDRSPSELLRTNLQRQCFHLEKLPQTLISRTIVEPINPSKILKPVRVHNGTLSFLMLDSTLHSDYLRNFIGDYGIYKYASLPPTLFIIDNNGETLYMQKGPISTSNAMGFLSDFYEGKLSRHLRSSTVAESSNASKTSRVTIKDINSRQFSQVVQWTNVTSVVLFYSPQCSLCYVMSQTLLHVSHIVNLENIKFYRMDGSANSVSWEYTMDKYPTLMVFPQNRSIDTSVYPSTLKINIKNVFGFILSKLKAEQQLKALINACILTKLSAAFQSCVRHVREMITNEINRNLNEWNRSPSQRTVILKRLNKFKEIYLELIRSRSGTDLENILKDIVTYENGEYSYIF